jgi:hypothetical protein
MSTVAPHARRELRSALFGGGDHEAVNRQVGETLLGWLAANRRGRS